MDRPAPTTVRPALPVDAPGIARVHVRAWQEAYAHLVPAAALAALDVGPRETRWSSILRDGVTTAVVAVDDTGEIVGWATAGPGRDTDAPHPVELEGIYVVATHHGTGAGQALLEAVVGERPAYLWVAADNPRAQAFYRRNGFTLDGAAANHPLAGTPVDIVRMTR